MLSDKLKKHLLELEKESRKEDSVEDKIHFAEQEIRK